MNADDIKNRTVVLAGATLLATVGRDRFYIMAQERRGILGRLASAFCQGHAARVGLNYAIFMQGRDKTRMTAEAIKFYSDDSLHGFGDMELTSRADGKPLLEQRRATLVPFVMDAIRKEGHRSVLEIGIGNGDVIAYLAGQFPQVQFTGIDLSVKNARAKHKLPNLRLIEGYALDELKTLPPPDLAFANSTFCIFAPKEFTQYLFHLSGTRQLFLSDPVVGKDEHGRSDRPFSHHMDSYMWFHNYAGYLPAAGWSVDVLENRVWNYTHNPNARYVIVGARNIGRYAMDEALSRSRTAAA